MEQEALLNGCSLTTYPLARRPDGGGRVGRRVGLCANHYLLDCSSKKAFQYDIEITSVPNIPPGLLDEKGLHSLSYQLQDVEYDRNYMFCPVKDTTAKTLFK